MICEFYVIVDENGDMGFGTDQGTAQDDYTERIGDDSIVRRAIKLEIEVPFSVPVLKGRAPAEGEATLTAIG